MMTPLGAVLTLIFSLMVFTLSRRMAAVAVIAAVCYLTEGQPLDLAGLHFTALRFVLSVGFIRIFARGESQNLRLNEIDKYVIAHALVISTISTLRIGTVAEFVYQLGSMYNIFLGYFLFRCLLRDENDYRDVLVKVGFVILPLVFLMLLESATNRNPFSVFGGVGLEQSSEIRYGHVRCQGPFRSPITAGAFGATFAMLLAAVLFSRWRTRAAWIGIGTSVLIMIFAHSSGAFLGMVLGLLVLCLWPWRLHTRSILWGIVACLLGVQLLMKEPIWFLLARMSDLVGGGGYHRAYLIDIFVRSFSSWWLAGTSDTQNWFPYELPTFGGADLTNIFVADGVHAGLAGLIVSMALVACCFKRLGIAIKVHRGYELATEKFLWGVGATLAGSIAILFSITYFDQMQVVWYLLLSCIAAVKIRRKQTALSIGKVRASNLQEVALIARTPFVASCCQGPDQS
jgi:hypothetical protein